MVNYKNIFKLISVIVLSFGSVLICTIFVNYSFDLKNIAHLITDTKSKIIFDSLVIQGNVAIAAAGGTLGATTFVALLFSIGQFIKDNSAQLGVMKALGYSENKIALQFIKFGCCVLLGAVPAFILACLGSPIFYGAFGGAEDLPVKVAFGFHIETVLILIIAPTMFFSLASFLYAKLKLNRSALSLINGDSKTKVNKLTNKMQTKENTHMFLKELKRNIFFQNFTLIFFIWFATFGFSSCVQIAFSMRQITQAWVTTAIFIILGFAVGAMMLVLSLSFVVNKNKKYLALLKAYGYNDKECVNALFGGYRLVSYVGFIMGTGYQFVLLKMLVSVFADSYGISQINFNFVGLAVTLVVFIGLYELAMLFYKKRITSIPLRQIMQQ